MSVWDNDFFSDSAIFDPLRIQRSVPIEDEEAVWVETLCQDATPGPVLIDDDAEGEGVVVATLPDGRHLVSLAMDAPAGSRRTAEANAQLICRARYLLLRFLRDRLNWQREREVLLDRIKTLEAAMDISDREPDQLQQQDEQRLPSQAR